MSENAQLKLETRAFYLAFDGAALQQLLARRARAQQLHQSLPVLAVLELISQAEFAAQFGVEDVLRPLPVVGLTEREVPEVLDGRLRFVDRVLKLRRLIWSLPDGIDESVLIEVERLWRRFRVLEVLKLREVHVGQVERCSSHNDETRDKDKNR